MKDYSHHEKKRNRIVLVLSIGLTLLAAGVSLWLAGPPPPKKIILATGVPGGAYDSYGQQYKAQLEKMGLGVELVNSHGAIENLHLLTTGKADVAFTQGGLTGKIAFGKVKLTGLAALYLEPVWVFTRANANIAHLSNLKGHHVSLGPVDSGTDAVARALLTAHGVTSENAQLTNASAEEAEQGLSKGDLDAVFIVSSPNAVNVQRLLRQEGIALMDFASQDMAHTRLFPFLRPVKIYAGLIDLANNVPATDKTVLAPAALLVSRENLHPQVVEQLHEVMINLHSGGDLLSSPNTFPTLDGVDLPIHETAEAYARSGGSFLSRMLPYWAVRWLWRFQVVLLPLIAVGFPAMKFLPQLYGIWGMRLVKRCYRKLRDIETRLDQAQSPDQMRSTISDLKTLRDSMWAKTHRMPAILQPDIYQWRTHVAEVCASAEEKTRRMTGEFL